MTDLVSIVGQLHQRGIQFRSLTEPFDTTTAGGELFFHICAAFAQMNGSDEPPHHFPNAPRPGLSRQRLAVAPAAGPL